MSEGRKAALPVPRARSSSNSNSCLVSLQSVEEGRKRPNRLVTEASVERTGRTRTTRAESLLVITRVSKRAVFVDTEESTLPYIVPLGACIWPSLVPFSFIPPLLYLPAAILIRPYATDYIQHRVARREWRDGKRQRGREKKRKHLHPYGRH